MVEKEVIKGTDNLAPIYIMGGSIEELAALRDLPLLYKFEENGERAYFLVEEHREFHDIWSEGVGFDIHQNEQMKTATMSINPLGPEYNILRRLAEKHGKEISEEEVMLGQVCPSLIVGQGNRGYIEYRFKAPEEQ